MLVVARHPGSLSARTEISTTRDPTKCHMLHPQPFTFPDFYHFPTKLIDQVFLMNPVCYIHFPNDILTFPWYIEVLLLFFPFSCLILRSDVPRESSWLYVLSHDLLTFPHDILESSHCFTIFLTNFEIWCS